MTPLQTEFFVEALNHMTDNQQAEVPPEPQKEVNKGNQSQVLKKMVEARRKG